MDNGTTKEVISQFDIIAKLPDYWDHSQQYQNYLLKHVIGNINTGLDVGCGTGEFTNKLALKCKRAIGIDISKVMIEEAKIRSKNANVDFYNIDVDVFLNTSNEKYDVIISIATFHHLNMERTLTLLKEKLSINGLILILDLYKNATFFEYLLSFIASLCNPFIYLRKRGSFRNTKEEREAWKDHFQYDKYYTITEVKEIAQRTLGNVRIRHHMFWRYSLVYRKNEETQQSHSPDNTACHDSCSIVGARIAPVSGCRSSVC
jgi:SAM-dependent methyltransferase